MTTAASLVLEFGDGVDAGAAAVAELDDERHETTNFNISQTEPIYFLVHLDANLTVEWVRTTSGDAHALPSVERTRDDDASFSFGDDYRKKTLKYNPAGTVTGQFCGNVPDFDVAGRQVTVDGDNGLPAIGWLTYPVNFLAYKLLPPVSMALPDGREQYKIEVRIKVVPR